MQTTPDNLDSFLRSRKRLANELKEGAQIYLHMQSHYPEADFIEVGGDSFPALAIGETVALQIEVCPE